MLGFGEDRRDQNRADMVREGIVVVVERVRGRRADQRGRAGRQFLRAEEQPRLGRAALGENKIPQPAPDRLAHTGQGDADTVAEPDRHDVRHFRRHGQIVATGNERGETFCDTAHAYPQELKRMARCFRIPEPADSTESLLLIAFWYTR